MRLTGIHVQTLARRAEESPETICMIQINIFPLPAELETEIGVALAEAVKAKLRELELAGPGEDDLSTRTEH